MRNLLLTLKFDGRDFCGFQIQRNGRTIQGEIVSAIEKLTGETVTVYGCSRTDAGVSAREFYLNFSTGSGIKEDRFPLALNFYLPPEISVTSCTKVPPDFNARSMAYKKEYIYLINTSRFKDPFFRGFCLEYGREIDLERLGRAASHFVGTQDFSSFVSAGATTVTTVRTVYEAKLSKSDNLVVFKVSANGFLYNMVRIMVGTLLQVNDGKLGADEISDILSAKNREKAGPTAPPSGLFLNRVFYNPEDFK